MREWHIVTVTIDPMVAVTRAGITLYKGKRIETLTRPDLGRDLESELGIRRSGLENAQTGGGRLDRLAVLGGGEHGGIIPRGRAKV